MPLGIVIPSDERRPLAVKEFNSIEDYQSVLGGYIEAISAGEGGLSIFANEEGKLIGLPLNRRATLLWHLRLYPYQPGDVLAGDVVLVGPTNARGDTLDVPVALRDFCSSQRQPLRSRAHRTSVTAGSERRAYSVTTSTQARGP